MSPSLASLDVAPAADADGLQGFDRATFEAWVGQHHSALVAYARALVGEREAARELSQEALLIAWRFRGRFDGQRGDLGAWIRGILRNKWRESARRRRLELLDEEELEAIEGLHRQWERVGEARRCDLLERVEDCVAKLGGVLEEAVRGHYFTGWSGPELAERLHSSETAIRKRLQRAREAVRDCLSRPD